MRQILKNVFLNSFSVFIVSVIFSGLKVKGGFDTYIIAGAILAFLSTILDPIVKFLTLPFNILTLGLLSFITTLVALFILTLVFPNIGVTSFTLHAFSFMGVQIKEIYVASFLSFIVISATMYFLNKIINWLFS